MNKELQDLAWSVLPKEFKEEVKRMWQSADKEQQLPHDAFLRGEYSILELLFGRHNLTSDAEEEEMLTCNRDVVRMLYDRADSVKVRQTLESLFGSKCLPDNVATSESNVDSLDGNVESLKPKPAEPKFNLGDIVRFKYCCTTYRIDGFKMSDGVMLYQVGEVWAEESDLEPYTEPDTSHETPVCENHSDNTSQKEVHMNSNRYLSQEPANYDKQFDTILKDGFSKERRLNIAARMAQAILTRVDDTPQVIADAAFRHADALIAESERRVK